MNFNSLKHLNHRVTIFRYTIASFEDDFDLISSRCYNILVNRKMNPKIVMMLAKQVQECQKKMPDGKTPYIKIGIKIIINESDITDVQAEIEGPTGTPYEGGIFRCKLAVENDFPNNPPKGNTQLKQATSSPKYSIPTSQKKEKFVLIPSKKIGIQPTGPSPTSLKSSNASSLYPSPKVLSTNKLAKCSWKTTRNTLSTPRC